ncbi:MAG TPA: alpha/beta hydrolase-fold protein, partial [Deinococcales bacterium]|nr:alpha/beta hydrolase-fold protein [Deinococcales bacterium]
MRPRANWLLALAALVVSTPAALAGQLTLVVAGVPADTPPGAILSAPNSINNWNPADPKYAFARGEDGRYRLSFAAPDGSTVQFKTTLGDWNTVETRADGGGLDNRQLVVNGPMTLEYTVQRWNSTAPAPARTAGGTLSGRFERIPGVVAPQLSRTLDLTVYLPPSYGVAGKRYPVLYLQDGQNVFDAATSFAGEWKADEAAETLAKTGKEVIMVGIPNAGVDRIPEYAPFPTPESRMSARGADFVAFLTETLKPLIDARFSTLPDRAHTGVAGSSMGGVISLYAGLSRPDVFGFVGALSPAMWQGGVTLVDWTAAHANPGVRVWLDAGTDEGPRYVNDAVQVFDLLRARGVDARLEVASGAAHNEAAWSARFPRVLEWFLSGPQPRTDAAGLALLARAQAALGGPALLGLRAAELRFQATAFDSSSGQAQPAVTFDETALVDVSAGALRITADIPGQPSMTQLVSPAGGALLVNGSTVRLDPAARLSLAANLSTGPLGLARALAGLDLVQALGPVTVRGVSGDGL